MIFAAKIDKAVDQTVDKILASKLPNGEKYEMLDRLYLSVLGRHPDGFAAKCLEVISDAETQVLYPNKTISEGEKP